MAKQIKKDEVMEILYPGYSEMSDAKKYKLEFRATAVTQYSPDIMAIFDSMKDQSNDLYQGDMSDKDIVYIASIYLDILNKSSQQIGEPTGRMLRGPDNEAIPEYVKRDRTNIEKKHEMERLIEEYNSKSKISLLLQGQKKYDIDMGMLEKIIGALEEEKETSKANINGSPIFAKGDGTFYSKHDDLVYDQDGNVMENKMSPKLFSEITGCRTEKEYKEAKRESAEKYEKTKTASATQYSSEKNNKGIDMEP